MQSLLSNQIPSGHVADIEYPWEPTFSYQGMLAKPMAIAMSWNIMAWKIGPFGVNEETIFWML